MSDNSYDSSKIIEAIYQSPIVNAEVNRFNVGTTAVPVLGINEQRSFIILQNNGSAVYIKLGLGASLTDYSFSLSSSGKASLDKWGGFISAVRENTTDILIITEVY